VYRKSICAAAAGLTLSLAATAASAATTIVLNFDDLTGIGLVPADYQGVHFGDDFSHYDTPDPDEYPTASGLTAIYTNYDKYKPGTNGVSTFRFDELVRFDGAYFSGHLGVGYELFSGGQRVYITPSTGLDNTARFYASGYDGLVDEVRVYGNSGNWAMDDLTYTTGVNAPVPEPGTWALMILGFGAAGAALRSQRRRAFA
jgi:hypothetical protein